MRPRNVIAASRPPCVPSLCAFSRDEPVVSVASWDREPLLAAYDLRSGELVAEHPLPKCGGEGYDLIPHPEGEAIRLGGGGRRKQERDFTR